MKIILQKTAILLLCFTLIICCVPAASAVNSGTLTSIKIPQATELIGEEAFLNCTSMKQVTIPETVIRIGDRAFYGCSNLKDFQCSSDTIVSEDAFKEGELIGYGGKRSK